LSNGQQADADGVMVLVSRQVCEEVATTLRALSAQALPAAPEQNSMPQYWSVNVDVDGESILSIGHDWVSGSRQLEEQDERTIIGAARHLLSFVGYGLPASTFDPDATPQAAQQAAQAPAGWLPIETAPKDELILVGPTKRMGICAAMHHSRDGWVTETCSEWATIYTPTHWQPLPRPPQPQEDAA